METGTQNSVAVCRVATDVFRGTRPWLRSHKQRILQFLFEVGRPLQTPNSKARTGVSECAKMRKVMDVGERNNTMSKATIAQDLATATQSDPRWHSVVDRDGAADGKFFYSVKTTGVYCRP